MGEREDSKSGTYNSAFNVTTIWKVLSYIKLKSGFTFGCLIPLCARVMTLGPRTLPKAKWLVSVLVNRSEMLEAMRRKEGAMGAGFHWDFWEALRIPPGVVNPRDRSLRCLLNSLSPKLEAHPLVPGACHVSHMDSTGFWGKWMTQVCLGGMMSFSTAMAGIRLESKGCDMGHQVSAQGWQIRKWHLYQGRAQVWFCPRAK